MDTITTMTGFSEDFNHLQNGEEIPKSQDQWTMEDLYFSELFDRFPSIESPHDLSEPSVEIEQQTTPNRNSRKRKQSFDETRIDTTESKSVRIRLYELDPNGGEYSPEMKAKILKAKQSRNFREAQSKKETTKNNTIELLTQENRQLRAKLETITSEGQKKDDIIQNLQHLLQQRAGD